MYYCIIQYIIYILLYYIVDFIFKGILGITFIFPLPCHFPPPYFKAGKTELRLF